MTGTKSLGDFRIADCAVRPSEHLIERDGESTRVEPQAMTLLCLLASRAGRVVARKEIEDEVWAGRVVGYEALTQTVAKLRKALGDDGRDARILVTAYDLFQRARSEKHKLNAEGEARAVELLRQTLELDPNFADAHVLLGWAGALQRLFSGQGPSFEESLASVQRGIELNPSLSVGYQALAQVLSFMQRHEEYVNAGRRAVELNPNDAENHIMFSRAASTAGFYREAVVSAEKAVALNPLYPKWYPFIYSRALYADDQPSRAVEICVDGMARQAFVPTAVTCIATLIRLGRLDDARAMAAQLQAMAPSLSFEQVMLSWGFRDEALNARFRDDLRTAGLDR